MRKRMKSDWADRGWRSGSRLTVALAALLLLSVYGFLLQGSWPLWQQYGIAAIVGGLDWRPLGAEPQIGIATMIASTLWCSAGALLLAAPLGIGGGVFLAELAPPALALPLRAAVQLLTGIPSVVYGFVGGAVLVPLFEQAGMASGESLFCASLVLALMVTPYIAAGTQAALASLPVDYRQTALALGVSRLHLLRHILLPLAARKISAAVSLAFARAAGETMAVLMVAGNTLNLPTAWWDKGETLSALIALELGSSVLGSVQWRGLFAAGLLLLLVVTSINLAAQWLAGRAVMTPRLPAVASGGQRVDQLYQGVFWSCGLLLLLLLSSLFGYLFVHGWRALSWEFISGVPRGLVLGSEGGIRPALYGTLALGGGALLAAWPPAFLCAVYFCEYSGSSWLERAAYRLLTAMAGLPSILTGLFGYSLFVLQCGFGLSLLSGALTLALMIFPTLLILTKNALSAVAQEQRLAALALGVGRFYALRRIVLPAAIPGLFSSALLALGHAAGATAPIIVTAAVLNAGLRLDPLQPVMALPYHLYMLFSQGVASEKAYGSALVLLMLLLTLNAAALCVEWNWKKARAIR